jgi:hypothetical protein
MKNKEIPIGGIGVINGYKVMAKEYLLENTCDDCCFSRNNGYYHPCPIKKCSSKSRTDKKNVYFEMVEKGGNNASN